MAYTDNQVIDNFQKQISRAPTPFEINKYKNASIQDLTNLKGTYAKYNPEKSLVDYLSFKGEDPSMKARAELAGKYGISDYTGSSLQNENLFKAIRGGAPKTTTPTVPGTITKPVESITPTTPTTPEQLSGTIKDATQPDVAKLLENTLRNNEKNYGIVSESPDIAQSRQTYARAQQAVLDVTSRINDINKAIDSALQNKRDEISRSGGIVDESQLRSTVLAENVPLLAERKDLLNQRSQLVGEQNIASKAYNDILSQSYKNAQLQQGAEKIAQAEEKINIQQTQFQQKLEQSGWKSAKVNVYDSVGNVIGNKIVWSESPANVSSNNKLESNTKTYSASGISSNISNLGTITTKNPPLLTLADGATPAQVLQSLVTGKPALYKGSTTPVAQQDLYNLAILDMLGSTSSAGGRTPSAMIPLIKEKETQIMNAYGLTPFDVAIAKTQFKNLSSTNAKLLERSSFTNLASSVAIDNLDLAVEQSKLVPRGGAKMVNHFSQWLQGNFTPAGDLAKLETYIYTYAREYGKVTSGSAQSITGLTDSATQEAEKLINSAQSPEVFAQVADAMKNDMKNVMDENNKAVSAFPDAVKALFGMASKAPELMRSSVPDAKTFVEKSLVRQGLHYDTLMQEMNANIPAGTRPALDNENGNPVYATEEDITSGKATPL